jgi:hypothetical protein
MDESLVNFRMHLIGTGNVSDSSLSETVGRHAVRYSTDSAS